MSRILSVSLVVLVSLLPAMTSGAPAPTKRVAHWHGYGFLPGYHQPPNNAIPVFGRKGAVPGEPDYSPQSLGSAGDWSGFGRPGLYRGQCNGGSFGPCWTWPPIGSAWNCGSR